MQRARVDSHSQSVDEPADEPMFESLKVRIVFKISTGGIYTLRRSCALGSAHVWIAIPSPLMSLLMS